jgi:hypothetical protein
MYLVRTASLAKILAFPDLMNHRYMPTNISPNPHRWPNKLHEPHAPCYPSYRRMYILFAISILCFFALVLAAIAIARHVRSRKTSTNPQNDFARHLFAAAEDQNSRTPRTLPGQNVKDVIAKQSWNHALEPIQANAANQSISSKRF